MIKQMGFWEVPEINHKHICNFIFWSKNFSNYKIIICLESLFPWSFEPECLQASCSEEGDQVGVFSLQQTSCVQLSSRKFCDTE